MLNKLKSNFRDKVSTHHTEQTRPPPIPGNHPIRRDADVLDYDAAPSKRDMYRHRKQFGVNLGAMFIGERWISDRLFSCCDAKYSSELSAVQAFSKKHGLDRARQEWEDHWSTWFTDRDAAYLSQHGINTVRIPLGFFSLSQDSILQDTEFAKFAPVYVNSWHHVERVIQLCAAHNIGVLLDLHALPGGQNGDAHAGTDKKSQDFYKDSKSRTQALRAVQALIDKSSRHENIVGVQVINEPSWGKEDFLVPFYTECLQYAAQHGHVPIYIGDCWNLGFWAQWAGQRDEFCVVDHHYYYCFTEEQRRLSPQQHIDGIRHSRELQEYAKNARGNIVVGEWSLAIDQASKNLAGSQDLKAARREFAAAQLETYTSQCGGAFFWTYTFQVRNNDNEWDLRDMLDFGFMPSPVQPPITVPRQGLDDKFNDIIRQKTSEHAQYWAQYSGQGQVYEHWRYEDGFRLGWSDALAFAEQGSRLGYLGEWQKKRRAGHVQCKQTSSCLWEFDAGFAAGVQALESLTR